MASVLAPLVVLAMFLENFNPRAVLFIVHHLSAMAPAVPVWWIVRTAPRSSSSARSVSPRARSEGPRRGFEILRRWRVGLIAGGVLAWTAARQFAIVWLVPSTSGRMLARHLVMEYSTLALVVVGATVAAMCLRSPVGRRAVLLIVPAASPFTVLAVASSLAGVSRYASPVPGEIAWLLCVALALVVVVLAVGGRRRPGGMGPLAPSPGG